MVIQSFSNFHLLVQILLFKVIEVGSQSRYYSLVISLTKTSTIWTFQKLQFIKKIWNEQSGQEYEYWVMSIIKYYEQCQNNTLNRIQWNALIWPKTYKLPWQPIKSASGPFGEQLQTSPTASWNKSSQLQKTSHSVKLICLGTSVQCRGCCFGAIWNWFQSCSVILWHYVGIEMGKFITTRIKTRNDNEWKWCI